MCRHPRALTTNETVSGCAPCPAQGLPLSGLPGSVGGALRRGRRRPAVGAWSALAVCGGVYRCRAACAVGAVAGREPPPSAPQLPPPPPPSALTGAATYADAGEAAHKNRASAAAGGGSTAVGASAAAADAAARAGPWGWVRAPALTPGRPVALRRQSRLYVAMRRHQNAVGAARHDVRSGASRFPARTQSWSSRHVAHPTVARFHWTQ